MWASTNLIGGHTALDFLNTVGDSDKTRDTNLLSSPRKLVSWIEYSGLSKAISVNPEPTQKVLIDLIHLREIAYRAVISIFNESAEENMDFQRYVPYLKSAIQRATFDVQSKPLTWRATKESDHHIVDSFVLLLDDLLRSADVRRLRQCERCSWLFINTGRGRGRRWCNMATCGNRHKVNSHRERSRTTEK